ncbi:MAG: hypothetical protein AB1742_00720 [bacterium]
MKRLVSLFTPSENEAGDMRRIWALTVAAAVGTYVLLPIAVPYDGYQYIRYAFLFTGQPDETVYWRTPGYPFVMLASGVTLFKSLIGLTVVQFVTSLFVPPMVYRITLAIDRRLAFNTALASVVSLVPFLYVKCVLTEHAYIFLLVLTIYLYAGYTAGGRTAQVYLLALALAYAALLRPSAILLSLAVLPLTVVFVPRRVLHSILAAVLIAGILCAWMLVRPSVTGVPGKFSPTGNLTGKALFANVYMFSKGRLADMNGPAAGRLKTTLLEYLKTHPDEIRRYGEGFKIEEYRVEHFFGRFEDDPEGLLRYAFKSPSFAYFPFMWAMMDRAAGPAEADRIILAACVEIIRERPGIGLDVLRKNFMYYFLTLPRYATYNVEEDARFPMLGPALGIMRFEPDLSAMEGLPERMRREVSFDPAGRLTYVLRRGVDKTWGIVYASVRPQIAVLALIGAIVLFRGRRHRALACGCFLALAYHSLVVIVFSEVETRFINQAILIEIILAAAGARWLIERIGVRRQGAPG